MATHADQTDAVVTGAGPATPARRVKLNYRPIRRVISIAASDSRAFREAVAHYSRVWGGALNFIAVEGRPGSWDALTEKILSTAEVDMLTVLGTDSEERERELVRRTELPVERDLRRAFAVPPLPAFAGIPTGASMAWRSARLETLPAWVAAVWGEPQGQEASDDGTEATLSLPYTGYLLSQWQPSSESALAWTARGIRARGDLRFVTGDPLIVIPLARGDDLRTLAFFWNLRAVLWLWEQPVTILPLWDIEIQPARFRRLIRQTLRSAPPGSHREVRVCAAGPVGREIRDKVAELFTATGPTEPTFEEDSPIQYLMGPLPELPPLTVRVAALETTDQPVPSPNGMTIRFEDFPGISGRLAVEVLGEPALVLPRLPSLGALAHPMAARIDGGIRIIRSARERFEDVTFPTDEDVVYALGTARGLRVTRSSAARTTSQLLHALGGLEAVRALRRPTAVSILRQLAPQRDSQMAGRDVARLPQRWLTLEQLVGRTRADRDRVLALVADLVGTGVLFSGLRVACSRCGYEAWRNLDDVQHDMTCVACRAQIRFRGIDARHERIAPEWGYTLNEVYSPAVDQGALAVLLALSCLADKHRHAFRAVPGVVFGDERHPDEEVDAVVCVDSDVYLLEAKNGGHLARGEVRKMSRLARALRARPCFATLGGWDEPTARLLASRHRATEAPLILEPAQLLVHEE